MSLEKLWPYDKHDKRTWKYIDVEIGGDSRSNRAYIKKWILNPGFVYKHLDPNYPQLQLNKESICIACKGKGIIKLKEKKNVD